MPQKEAVLPPRVPFPAMRAVLNDVFGVDPSALLRYREALAMDEAAWECTHCGKGLQPYTLCAETVCIAQRLNATLRRVTITC